MKTVRFQLQLYKQFRFEELEDHPLQETTETVQTALIFDKGQITHPTNRKLTLDLKGFILFSLPHGEYPEIPEYDMDRLDKELLNWVVSNRLQDPETDLYGRPIKDIFYLAPTLKPWNKKTEIAIKALYWCRTVDIFFTESLAKSLSGSSLLDKDHFADFSKFITNIMEGLYRNEDGIPNIDIPFLNFALKAFFKLYVKLRDNVAGYEANYKYLLSELQSWIQSYKIRTLYMIAAWDQLQQANYIFKRICGKRVIVEWLQLLTATYVEDCFRNNLLFKIFCNSGDTIQVMTTDAMCLAKDLKPGNSSNIIIRNTLKRGMSFDESFTLHMTSLNNEIIDFKRNAEALAMECPTEQVQRYIFNYQCLVDGFIRLYCTNLRYGQCKWKFCKAIPQNETPT